MGWAFSAVSNQAYGISWLHGSILHLRQIVKRSLTSTEPRLSSQMYSIFLPTSQNERLKNLDILPALYADQIDYFH